MGIDPSIEMLRVARKKQLQGGVIQGYAETLPWRSGVIDRLFCINAFHHFVDKAEFIREARRVIQPGGGILIIGLDPHTRLDRWWIYEYFPQVIEIDKKRYPSTPAIRELLASTGFINCNTDEVLHWPIELDAHLALASGRLAKTTTSQLTVLTDDEYHFGINKLTEDIKAAETKGKVHLISADLRPFATTGWRR
jgi:SAM-dependent methyltransferase